MALEHDKYGCHQCPLKSECDNVSPAHKPPCSKLADKNFNNLQQLKAEIADLLSRLPSFELGCGNWPIHFNHFIKELQQLSDV